METRNIIAAISLSAAVIILYSLFFAPPPVTIENLAEKNKMNIFTLILIKFIKAYKYLISPLLGHSCRYLPTCSEYSIDALNEHGFFKGLFMSIKRILSCHPIKFLGGGEGFDPVKEEMKDNK